MLVIDEGISQPGVWMQQLRQLFAVVTAASLAGASVAIDGHELVAIVLVLDASENGRARTLVEALRRRRGFDQVPVFVISTQVSLLAAELVGLSNLDVLDPQHAQYDLSLRVGASASRMSSRPAPRRLARSSDIKALTSPDFDPTQRLLARFAQECSQRGQRGLSLCERLSARESSSADRQRAAEDLRNMLNLIRADASVLQQSELSQLLGLAEQVMARLNTIRGQVMVPRGVVGLLSALADLRDGPDQLRRFDAELHRIRLESALGRARE